MNQYDSAQPHGDDAQQQLRATRERLEAMGLHGDRLEQAELEQRGAADPLPADDLRARQFVVANQSGRG